ncbi:16965_t:CDS:2, partial [Dentiscutata erythropus]
LNSSVNDDNSKLLSLNAQLKTKTIDINLNTTRQFLHLMNQRYAKMKASKLLAKSLGKGPWHAQLMLAILCPLLEFYECEDVVEYKNDFLQEMSSEAEIISVTQDEATLYANNSVKQYWSPKGEYGLQRKSQGLSIYISDFVYETIRRLKLSDYEIAINDLLPDSICFKYTEAGVAIYLGINHDTLFMFDNSSNHGSFAEDALLVLQMGMKDGTKKLLLCTSKYRDGSEYVMTYRNSNGVLKPKGIRRALEERGLWIPDLIKKCNTCKKNKPDPTNLNCCTSHILSAQSDFASQRSHL